MLNYIKLKLRFIRHEHNTISLRIVSKSTKIKISCSNKTTENRKSRKIDRLVNCKLIKRKAKLLKKH